MYIQTYIINKIKLIKKVKISYQWFLLFYITNINIKSMYNSVLLISVHFRVKVLKSSRDAAKFHESP